MVTPAEFSAKVLNPKLPQTAPAETPKSPNLAGRKIKVLN
jgi:hypothetical protein